MIVADIGESNVEEVNIIEKGGDYGWSVIEGTFGIDPLKDQKVVFEVSDKSLEPFKLPFGQFDHKDGMAISGGYVYDGPLENLRGKYILGDIALGKFFFMDMKDGLTDPTIYTLGLVNKGKRTTLMELSGLPRVNLRFGYDERNGDLFVMTKDDGMVRRVVKAYFIEVESSLE